MAAIHFLGARFRSFKNDGTVNASGTVEFFEVGTSTPKTTYSDSGLTSPNAAIITLDSAGAADIWYMGDADIAIKDSDGNTIDTFSNINPEDAAASSTGNYNYVLNPSFELDAAADGTPSDWDMFTYTGATATQDTSDPNHGDAAFKITTANPSNGGGYITSTNAFFVSVDEDLHIEFSLKASDATITNKFQVLWYDKDDLAVSTSTLYNEGAASPTSWARIVTSATPPATAVKAKVRVILADPATSTIGSGQVDGIVVRAKEHMYAATAAGTDTYTATLAPIIIGYETNRIYSIKFTNANTSTTPTLNLNGLGAKTIKKEGGAALVAGNIAAAYNALLKYDGTDFLLLNPVNSSITPISRRQTVACGSVDSNGAADFISPGTGLACDLAATTVAIYATFARGYTVDGAYDSIQQISADVTSAWSSLTASATNYLYIQDDGGSVSYGNTTNLPPVYGSNYYEDGGSVRSYLSGNGSDTSTTFTDTNPRNSWTASGNAQLDTAQKKFGTASMLFDGTGDWITNATTGVNMHPGINDGGFEISCWVRLNTTGSNKCIVGCWSSNHMELRINASDQVQILLGNGSTWSITAGTNGTTALSSATWYKIRFIWDGATYKVYLSNNGAAETEEISLASSTGFALENQGIFLGRDATATVLMNGWIDDFVYRVGPQTVGTETPDTNPHGGYVNGEHWFDTSKMVMQEWVTSTATWTERARVFAGEAVTDGSSVTSAITYALNGSYKSPEFAVAQNTLYSKSHNLGVTPINFDSYLRENDAYSWVKNQHTDPTIGGLTRADRLVAKTGFDTNIGSGGAALESYLQQEAFSAAATAAQCYIQCDRGW